MLYEWMSSWYNSAIGFALVEVNARTQNQITLMFCIYVVNAMINAYLIGVFIDQFSVKNEKKTMKQEQLDDSNNTMANLKIIPDELKVQVRTFFLQSFQMKMLQREFQDINEDLKKSLQQRMKFEIAERIIGDSPTIFYFRLFMIQQFFKRRDNLEEKKPDSALLQKLTPLSVANEYKIIMFELINKLQMDHHEPDQKVVEQNSKVLDEGDEFDDDKANVYFIMTGNYKVQSLMFNMQRKRTDMEGSAENPGIVDRSKQKIKTKGLRSGDMFGEVSIIFGCRRTATVKAKQYCESAFLTHKDFNHIIANHSVLKNFLVKNILANYDDELRIFLTSCLKEISYLSNLSEEIIVHISMMMIADTADKDSYLINANDSFKQQDEDVYGAFMHGDTEDRKAVPLMIIYDGQLCMSIKVDSGTELPLAYVSRGAILNSTNFLVRNTQNVSAQCLTSLTYYYLPYRTLHMLAGVYTELRINL